MGNVVATSPRYSSDWLKHETDPQMGRREITVKGGTGRLGTGTVLGMITASNKWTLHDPAAADGSEVAKAILYVACDATSADVKSTAVIADAIVAPAELTFKAGISAPAKAAALVSLLTSNIQTVAIF